MLPRARYNLTICGICGVVDLSRKRIDAACIESMTAALQHRGPDDTGTFVGDRVMLGQTRLSILDLSDAGHQPMRIPSRLTLVYNGEIYNFRELRAELEKSGVTFRSHSDTEVVLHAYDRWGEQCFERFNGMFTVALWDERRETLVIARDRFGIKPLYYAQLPWGIVFGSEIKALLTSGLVDRRVSWSGLHEYLYYGNALGRQTLFEGVERLAPGHVLSFRAGTATIDPFWSLANVKPIAVESAEAAETIRHLLEQAVHRHLVADVPVGVVLSGGIDSSAITALASHHYAGRLSTYSVAFDFDTGPSELPRAKAVAQAAGTEHHELHVGAGDLCDVLGQLVRAHDEPFGDAANVPLFLLYERLRGSLKVALQGDGGDEIFGGYRRYTAIARWPHAKWSSAIGGVLTSVPWPGQVPLRAHRFLRALSQPERSLQFARLLTNESDTNVPTRALSREVRQAVERSDPFAHYRTVCARYEHLDPLQQMLYVDTSILLPDTFLEKVDRPSMANSLEIRVPFLDTELTDYALGLPSSLKMPKGRKKSLLRRALRGIVPDEVLDGHKRGFSVPVAEWLRGPLARFLREVLLDESSVRSGLLDNAAVNEAIEAHDRGERDESFLLYRLMNLMIWHRTYMEEDAYSGRSDTRRPLPTQP